MSERSRRRAARQGSTRSVLVHRIVQPAFLDKRSLTPHDMRGLLHLAVLLLLVSNLRLVLNNMLTFGLIAFSGQWVRYFDDLAALSCAASLPMYPLLAFLVERAKARGVRGERWVLAAHVLIGSATLAVPIAVVTAAESHPMPALALLVLSLVLTMKLVSYAVVNFRMRRRRNNAVGSQGRCSLACARRGLSAMTSREEVKDMGLGIAAGTDGVESRRTKDRMSGEAEAEHEGVDMDADGNADEDSDENADGGAVVEGGRGLQYPDSVTARNLAYFICLPTLIYQNEWPTLARRREWWRIAWNLLQFVFVLIAMRVIVEQYMIPYIAASIVPLEEMTVVRIFDRMTRLAVPNTYLWLLGFYGLFHLWFQILAELTLFGDRRFYGDWWNSTTLTEYWSLWNLPVHNFLLEYVYKPVRMAGLSRHVAFLVVFTVSGLGHEILVSVPLRTFKFWTLVAFWVQIPLMIVSEKYLKGSVWGNVFFWVSFPVVGQIAILNFYLHDIFQKPDEISLKYP